MNTGTPTARLADADADAVLEQFAAGTPLDPVIAERVHARAEQITEDIRLTRGHIDDDTFQSLLDDET